MLHSQFQILKFKIKILKTFQLNPPIDGECVSDQFIISGQSMNSPVPIICGINSGQHSKKFYLKE